MTTYRLLVWCPSCGTRPRLRVYASASRRYDDLPPDEPVGTYQCHIDGCGTIYPIPARAYQRAAPPPDKAA